MGAPLEGTCVSLTLCFCYQISSHLTDPAQHSAPAPQWVWDHGAIIRSGPTPFLPSRILGIPKPGTWEPSGLTSLSPHVPPVPSAPAVTFVPAQDCVSLH
jgi:hypothetical protein